MRPTQKVFELQNPESYFCRVLSYSIGHQEMVVEVSHTEEEQQKFYVVFSHVFCFSGTMRWKGATLRITSDEEYMEFIRQIMPIQNIPDKELVFNPSIYGELFVFEAKDQQVKIVAGSYGKLSKL